jgi:hypothetical protein
MVEQLSGPEASPGAWTSFTGVEKNIFAGFIIKTNVEL